MTEYVKKAKSIASNLSLAGSLVTDSQMVISLLCGLGPEYLALASSVTSQVEPIPLDDFIGILLSQDF